MKRYPKRHKQIKETSFKDLPYEMIFEITRYLSSSRDFHSLMNTTRWLYNILQENVWYWGTDRIEFRIHRLPVIKRGYVKWIRMRNHEHIDDMMRECRNVFVNIKEIDLNWCYKVTDAGLAY